MGLPASFAPEQLEVAQVLHGAPLDPEEDTGPWTLRMPLLHPATSGFSVEAGLALVELPARDGLPAGLALMPYADGALQESFPLDTERNWQLAISGGLDLQGGLAVIVRPGQPLRLIADVARGSERRRQASSTSPSAGLPARHRSASSRSGRAASS